MNPKPNKTQIIHPEQYGGTIVNKPIIIDNTGQYQRHTLQYGNQINNPMHNPQTVIKDPNTYNFQNIPITPDNRKTFTPGQLRTGNANTLLKNENYMVAPGSGKQLPIQPQKNQGHAHTHVVPHNNNNIINNTLLNENNVTETYYIDPETGNKVQLQTKTYQPHANLSNTVLNDGYMEQPNINNTIIGEKMSPIIDINNTISPGEDPMNDPKKQDLKKSATLMTVSTLANLPYNHYPTAEFSSKGFANISGYGMNSYNGKVKKYNEDRIKAITDYQPNKTIIIKGAEVKPTISYFSIFDGHGGKKCSDFLKEHLDSYLFNSSYFPRDPYRAIRESFKKAEDNFCAMAYDPKNKILIDKSGSCALVMLIINDILFSINLGDSRALYSYDTGKYLYQITRDHKPNDEIEKQRIENAGGKVYYANKVTRGGKEIELKEENYGKGFSFPYRVIPGKIAVARTIGDYYAKIPELGGVKGTLVSEPCINLLRVDHNSDFLLLGCDGIFDRLDNDQIINKIWSSKKLGQTITDIHSFCGKITDAIIKYSMEKNSVDNVSVIFIAFKNFENKLKDPNFVYKPQSKCQVIKKDKVDFSLK